MIRHDLCLTMINESDEPFPEWVRPESHTCAVGCLECQRVCPQNWHLGPVVAEPGAVRRGRVGGARRRRRSHARQSRRSAATCPAAGGLRPRLRARADGAQPASAAPAIGACHGTLRHSPRRTQRLATRPPPTCLPRRHYEAGSVQASSSGSARGLVSANTMRTRPTTPTAIDSAREDGEAGTGAHPRVLRFRQRSVGVLEACAARPREEEPRADWMNISTPPVTPPARPPVGRRPPGAYPSSREGREDCRWRS